MVILGIIHSWVYHGVCQSVSLQSPKKHDGSTAQLTNQPSPSTKKWRLQRGFPQAIIVEVKLILRDVAEMLEGLVEPGLQLGSSPPPGGHGMENAYRGFGWDR